MFIVIPENISEYISKNFGSISSLLIFRSNELKKYLSENDITNDYKQYSQIVYNAVNSIHINPKCNCGNLLKFVNYSTGYREYCSVKCRANDIKWQNQVKLTLMDSHGVTNVSQIAEVQLKKKATYKNSRGYDWGNDPSTIQKKKDTNLVRYGVEHPQLRIEIQDKTRKTMISRYGEGSQSVGGVIYEKRKAASLEKYGYDNPNKSSIVRDKIKATNLLRYGVENPSQNTEVYNKQNKSAYNSKIYRGFSVRGFENRGIDYLLDVLNIHESDITTSQLEISARFYTHENKVKRYYPDILIKSLNKLIEIKSDYTWRLDYDKNLQKMTQTENIELWVYSKTSNTPIIFNKDVGYPPRDYKI